MADLSAQIKNFNVEKFMQSLEEVKPSNEFERLPKPIQSLIFNNLSVKELGMMQRMNKYLFKSISASALSNTIWKNQFVNYLGEKIDEKDIEEFQITKNGLSNFEQQLSVYYLYYKYWQEITWDPSYCAPGIKVEPKKNQQFLNENSGKKKKKKKI